MAEPISSSAIVAKALATPAVKKSLDSIVTGTGKLISRLAKSTRDRVMVDLRIGFAEYFMSSYNKCKYFKTILNPNEPLEVLSNYVNLGLSYKNKVRSDISVISELPSLRHVVVSGLAGSGKSMFMKYMTMSFFEGDREFVPLFVELRHLNSHVKGSLLTYVKTACTSRSSRITQEQFELSLKTGGLMLILDGFDELNYEYRDSVQRDILETSKSFPDMTIIVSSRPDLRFGSWSSFFVYEVSEMTKKECLKLIGSLSYDDGVKRRFSSEVKNELYDKYTSFLKSPLLTTIMLLTYESFAEIPDRMHTFYAQAFDTLFQKHDAQKEQFQRKMHTGLSREDFKACFAAFCALSYFEEKYSFDETSLHKIMDGAMKYFGQSKAVKITFTSAQMVDDLRESVCMLHQDGTDIAFVHRSFQEYFTAFFLTNLHGPRVKNLLDRCALRYGDSVIPMARDMDQDTIEQEWVLPVLDELEVGLELREQNTNAALVFSKITPSLGMKSTDDGRSSRVEFPPIDRVASILRSIAGLYPVQFSKYDFDNYCIKNHPDFRKLKTLLTPENKGKHNYDQLENCFSSTFVFNLSDITFLTFSSEDEWWIQTLNVTCQPTSIRSTFDGIRSDIKLREKARSTILEAFAQIQSEDDNKPSRAGSGRRRVAIR